MRIVHLDRAALARRQLEPFFAASKLADLRAEFLKATTAVFRRHRAGLERLVIALHRLLYTHDFRGDCSELLGTLGLPASRCAVARPTAARKDVSVGVDVEKRGDDAILCIVRCQPRGSAAIAPVMHV